MITDKQVEAACVAMHGEMEFSMASEKLRERYLGEMRAALEAAEAAREPADYPNPGAPARLRPAVTEQEPAAHGEMTPADIEVCVRENQIIRAELYAQGYSEFDKDGTLIPTDEMVRRAMSKPAAQGEAGAPAGYQVRKKSAPADAPWGYCSESVYVGRTLGDEYDYRPLYTAPPADARDAEDARPIPTPDEARNDWYVAFGAHGVDLLTLSADGSYRGLGNIDDYADIVRSAARTLRAFVGVTDPIADAWPECSGDPACCPENEGYGCCRPNPGDARDGDTALLDWIESQYKSTSVQMSGIATYVATGQALRQLRGRSFRDAIRRAMGGES